MSSFKEFDAKAVTPLHILMSIYLTCILDLTPSLVILKLYVTLNFLIYIQ